MRHYKDSNNQVFGYNDNQLHLATKDMIEIDEAEMLKLTERKLTPLEVRDAALNSLTHDFGDGRVIQVRPKDRGNFADAYKLFALGATEINWLMLDNKKQSVTEADLREAENSGILQGAAIWDSYNP